MLAGNAIKRDETRPTGETGIVFLTWIHSSSADKKSIRDFVSLLKQSTVFCVLCSFLVNLQLVRLFSVFKLLYRYSDFLPYCSLKLFWLI